MTSGGPEPCSGVCDPHPVDVDVLHAAILPERRAPRQSRSRHRPQCGRLTGPRPSSCRCSRTSGFLEYLKHDPDVPESNVTRRTALGTTGSSGRRRGWSKGSSRCTTDCGGFGQTLVFGLDYSEAREQWLESLDLLQEQVVPKVQHVLPECGSRSPPPADRLGRTSPPRCGSAAGVEAAARPEPDAPRTALPGWTGAGSARRLADCSPCGGGGRVGVPRRVADNGNVAVAVAAPAQGLDDGR